MADRITTEVLRSKFEALLGQMKFLLVRSAYSTLTRESRDCSFGICTAGGEMPFEGAGPHVFIYGRAARRLLARASADGLREGDVFIGNDPHEIGVGHSPDVLVMTPVLYGGALVAFCGSIAHKMDIGGAVPGSIYSGATEVYQEGLVIPFMRLYEQGKVVPQVEEVVRANVRNGDVFLGDLGAQVGATLVAADRIKALAARYGVETLQEAFEEMLAAPQERIRMAVERWPGRTAEAEAVLDPPPSHGRPVRLHLRVTREGGHLTFDFSGSEDQVRAPVNVPTTRVLHICGTCVLGMAESGIAENAGMARAFTLVAREGSVANPLPPAPVGNTTMVIPAYIDMLVSALCALKGQGAVAERGGHGTTALGWRGGLVAGRTYVQYELQASASGASEWCDGVSAANPLHFHYSRRSLGSLDFQETPVEALEVQYPVRVRRYEIIADSGGAGRFRGGAAPRRLYELLAPAYLNVRHARGFSLPAKGVGDGRPGRRGRVVVNLGAPSEEAMEGWGQELKAGDTWAFEGGGGGGAGDPQTRDPRLVLRDVREGFVSVEGAQKDYGVVVARRDSGLALDAEATLRLRSGQRAG